MRIRTDDRLIVTDDKEGASSMFQKEIHDVSPRYSVPRCQAECQTEILITTPFHPGYLTAELFEKAKKLKLAVTAGVGSEYVILIPLHQQR
jgi:formate dehydrogenase